MVFLSAVRIFIPYFMVFLFLQDHQNYYSRQTLIYKFVSHIEMIL